MKSEFDISNIKTITSISEVLGKYGYKFDSAKSRLVKILRDSAKTKVVLPDNPVLVCTSFQFYKKFDGKSFYKLSLIFGDSGSTGFDIRAEFLGLDTLSNLHYFGEKSPFNYDYKIGKNGKGDFYYSKI